MVLCQAGEGIPAQPVGPLRVPPGRRAVGQELAGQPEEGVFELGVPLARVVVVALGKILVELLRL